MRILHLTDLHYTSRIGNLTKQNKLIENFINDLNHYKSKIDYVIFSGDLVKFGNEENDFYKAKNIFLDKILSTLNINKDNFFICAGNHDVNRSLVSNSLIKYLDEEINNNDDLDSFFKATSTDLENSYKPLLNYNNFIKSFYNYHSNDEYNHFDEMYSSHIRESKNGKIGFVTINTSWRAVGKNDDNNLLFPISKIDEALDRIMNCETKILIHHHPLSNIKAYNIYELEDLLHKRFDYMLSGHVHKNNLALDLTPNDGVVKLGTSANLSFDIDSQIGYTLINIDFNELIFNVDFRMYDNKNEVFYSIPQKSFSIPTSEIKKEQNKLRKNIRKRFLEELEDSKELFVETKSRGKNLLELSTNPVLKEKSLSEMFGDEEKTFPDFQWNKFYEFNTDYIIFGKDKCGKTVMLKKLELELLKDYSQFDYIPFYIDVKFWYNSNRTFDFEKEFAKYYFINVNSARKLLNEKSIILLVDNFQVNHSDLKNLLETVLSENENFRLIICSISSALGNLENTGFDGRTFSKLYFHRLRKIHIKALTKKNYDLTEEREEQVVDKINSIFKKLSIPFNYWTVSIFLWVFNKDANNNLHNDVDLINLYIEKLLEKEQLTVSASTFTFSNYKKLLAYLAYYLLKNHHSDSYYAKYSEIIEFIQNQLDKNPRLITNPKDIFDYLDSKGLLRKKEPDLYSFRLNGVFEYFVAYYMTFDDEFLDRIISDKNFYLSFTNEFELYAGFKRDDLNFLKKIYNKTKESFNELNIEYDLNESTIDSLLISKVTEADKLGDLIEKYTKKFQNGLTEFEQDQIEEEMIKEMKLDESHSDVKKKKIKSINNSATSLEESLKILGKVYRNVDDINDSALVYEIFDYIIDNACLWSYKLLDEFGEMDISDIIKTDNKGEAKYFLKLISNLVPTLVQVRLYDMIGHVNLEAIILERLEDAKKYSSSNQFKLFLYSFLLLDINYHHYKNIIEKIIPLVKIPIIKYSFIVKLNYYLGFKNNLDKNDKKHIKNNIQSQYLKFNNKIGIGEIQKGLSKKGKKSNIDKGRM